MLYYRIARLQTVAGLIYSVLLLTTHGDAAGWLPKSRSQWIEALDSGLSPLLRRKEVESFALQQLDCVECTEKNEIVINDTFNGI